VQTEAAVSEFVEAFQAWSGKRVHVVDSVTWYSETFATCGNWDSWIWETTNGVDFGTRKRHFAGFVVLADTLGRANAAIVQNALRDDTPVFSWLDRQMGRVTNVIEHDANHWVGGWSARSVPFGA
jgi:hypothetical protein